MTAAARRLALVLLLAFVGACAHVPQPVSLPPPVQATSVDAGDVIEVQIVGEDKLPTVFRVAPDGTVDLPYLKRQHVAGLEPQEIQDLIRQKLIEGKILTDPSVSVNVKDYNSKTVEVLGEVQRPGSFPLQPGMTLLRAISLAGGFNAIADRGRVRILRKTKAGTASAMVSAEDIIDNRLPDVPLQAGDSIDVKQRVF